MSDHASPYVNVAVCGECQQRPSGCICADGFLSPIGRQPHAPRCHCCKCGAMTHEIVQWWVGDSYSLGPLCLDCRNGLDTTHWVCTGLDSPHILKWAVEKQMPPTREELARASKEWGELL